MEKCTASAHHPSNLGNKAVPCWDTFSVPRYLFSLFRMRRPTTTSYLPILPAAIMLEGVNPSCGDDIFLKLKLDGDTIADGAFVGDGCAISQASADIMLGMIIGKRRKTR